MIINTILPGSTNNGSGVNITNKIVFDKADNPNPVIGDIYINIASESVIAASSQNITKVPNGYLNNSHYAQLLNIEKCYMDTNQSTATTNRAQFGVEQNSISQLYLTFNTSNLPTNYQLISFQIKFQAGTVSQIGEYQNLYFAAAYGTDIITSTQTSLTTASVTKYTMPIVQCNDWADLQNVTLYVQGKKNTTYQRLVNIYGAELIINYTQSAECQTIIYTQKYDGTEWVAHPIGQTFDVLNYQCIP